MYIDSTLKVSRVDNDLLQRWLLHVIILLLVLAGSSLTLRAQALDAVHKSDSPADNGAGNSPNGSTPTKIWDFWGNGKTSFTIARANGTAIQWLSLRNDDPVSGAPGAAGIFSSNFGIAASDTVTPGSYDNDGKFDIGIWRPSTISPPGSSYYYKGSASTSNQPSFTVPWGISTDFTGLEADYDGDGRTDICVVRDDGVNLTWYWLGSTTGYHEIRWGLSDRDIPLPGEDYDGNGTADITVGRTNTAFTGNITWLTCNATTGATIGAPVIWGNFDTDFIVSGNFMGDARADFAVWRGFGAGTDGRWYIITNNGTSAGAGQTVVQFGIGSATNATRDVPLRGDFDGDGRRDIAVFRRTDAKWYILRSSNGALTVQQWGAIGTGDLIIPALGVM